MLAKGSVVQQLNKGSENQRESETARKRRVVEKLMKITYFISRKKWAVKQNFEDVVRFIGSLGEADIEKHCHSSAQNATYMSTTSVEGFLDAISTCLENDLQEKLASCAGFSILADESTDERDREQMTVFIRYVDRATHTVHEVYLAIVQIKADKTAGALLKEIIGVLATKGLNPEHIRFSGFDGTNTMSGERTGLQRRVRHVSPHALYVNCRNHRLALVFVHLMKQFPVLQQLDRVLLTVWKMFKYSTIKNAVFKQAQVVEGLVPVKMLKACTTRWLSHGDSCCRVISRWEPLLDSLDTIYHERGEPEVKGCRDQLLEVCLMLLLVADILVWVNQFSKFLQRKNLDYTSVPTRFAKLKQAMEDLKLNLDQGRYFCQAVKFVESSDRRAQNGRSLRRLGERGIRSATETVHDFKQRVAGPFLTAVIKELEESVSDSGSILKHFDVFNPGLTLTYTERVLHLDTLVDFYGNLKVDTNKEGTVYSQPIIDRVVANQEKCDFLSEFERAVDSCNNDLRQEVVHMVRQKKIIQSEAARYIDNHPVESATIFRKMCGTGSRTTTPNCMELFELYLLIPPSTANVERGFSVMNLVCSPLRTSLNQSNVDRLMRISLNGPENLSEQFLEKIVDYWFTMKERRL